MKPLALLVFALVTTVCFAAEPESWFRAWPRDAVGQEVPSARVVEMPHSLFSSAQEMLAERAAVAIGPNYFPGFRYECPVGTSAYLVRALYEHANTGMFNVQQLSGNLLVRHYALGSKSELHRSALVVCLDFEPKQVYVSVGGAM